MSNLGALAGLKVIDLSRVLAGPYCTQILADHGAEVIKIEPPQGDETRLWGPPFDGEKSAYFNGLNRNKKAMAVDLRKSEGQEILFSLLQDADVLVHNFKPGTLEKWGMGYETVLKQRFPRLIYCQISGFGEDGPLGGLPGYDAAVQAVTGTMSINGTPESGPVRMGTPIVDLGTGLNAAIAVLLAIVERGKSGLGQKLDLTLYDCAISLLHPQAANCLMSGKTPQQTGNAHPNISPYDMYQTQTGPVFLAVGNNGQFQKLCEQLGKPDLAKDPLYLNNGDRVVNREALKRELEALLSVFDCEALADVLLKKGVPAGAVQDVSKALAADHTRHREMVVTLEGYRGAGIAQKLSRTPGSVKFAPPQLGEHNRDLCREIGLTDQQITALTKAGVLNG